MFKETLATISNISFWLYHEDIFQADALLQTVLLLQDPTNFTSLLLACFPQS